jgi:hypothetical protein
MLESHHSLLSGLNCSARVVSVSGITRANAFKALQTVLSTAVYQAFASQTGAFNASSGLEPSTDPQHRVTSHKPLNWYLSFFP